MNRNCPCVVESPDRIVETPPHVTRGEKYNAQAALGWLRRESLGLIEPTPEGASYKDQADIAPLAAVAQRCAGSIVAGECSKWLFVEDPDGYQKLFPRDLHLQLADEDRPNMVGFTHEETVEILSRQSVPLGDLHPVKETFVPNPDFL